MTAVWVDTNVLLRFLTNEPEEQAKRARTLMRRAEAGEIALIVPIVVLAEVVWVMHSYYGHALSAIAQTLWPLVATDGIVVENADIVLETLRLMSERSLKFADAYLVASAVSRGEAIATFDVDLHKLGAKSFAV